MCIRDSIKTPYMNTNETYMNTKDAIEYKKHTIFGYSSVQDEDWIPDIAKEIILLHHERIDGKGYPCLLYTSGIFIYLWQKLFKLLKHKFHFLAKHIYNSRNYLGYLNP